MNDERIVPGTIIKRWKVEKLIGQGGYGRVYQGIELQNDRPVAIKVVARKIPDIITHKEIGILRYLRETEQVVQFISSGKINKNNYIVMELEGESVNNLRHKQSEHKLSVSTALRIGHLMLKAITVIHDKGILHRDISPANFAIGLSERNFRKVVLLDFGLAKKFDINLNQLREARGSRVFYGTLRYASVNMHRFKELGPVDDLWSLVYVIVEMVNGTLPWSNVNDDDSVGFVKGNITNARLLKGLPREFYNFVDHLQQLSWNTNPNYPFLSGLFMNIFRKENINMSDPYDWEETAAPQFPSTSTGIVPPPQTLIPLPTKRGSAKKPPGKPLTQLPRKAKQTSSSMPVPSKYQH